MSQSRARKAIRLSRIRHSAVNRHRLLTSERLEPRCLLASDIQGLVWNDVNQNGLFNAGEPGLPDTLVELVATTDSTVGNSDDSIVGATATDSAGSYKFSGAAAGQYYLRFRREPVAGIGHRFTTADVGSDDSIDSDVIPAEGRSAIFSQTGITPTVISAGLIQEPTKLAFAFPIGGEATQWGRAVAVDGQGNIYVGVRTDSGNIDLDPGPAVTGVTFSGGSDQLVAKYNSAGQFLWGRSFGGTAAEEPESLAVDAQGNVYLAGTISGNSFFGPGSGQTTLTGSGQRAFAAKFDPTGNVLWARQLHELTKAADIAVDAAGNAYVTGFDFDQFPSFNPPVWKLDTNGTQQWQVQTQGAANLSQGQGIYATESTIYVTGRFQGTADFDPSSAVANLTSSGSDDVFLWRLDPTTGAYRAVSQIGGIGSDVGSALTMSPDGDLVITGNYTGTVDFDPTAAVSNLPGNGLQGFVAKLHPDGRLVWARSAGVGTAEQDVVVTGSGQVWSTGTFVNTPDFDPAPSTQRTLVSKGGTDVYLWGLDSSGNFIDVFGTGSPRYDNSFGIALTPGADRVIVSGNLEGLADLDPGAGTLMLSTIETANPQASALDAFVWAMTISPPISTPCTVVVNTNDTGVGSLREAINCANAAANVDRNGDGVADPDVISFNIPGSGVRTISPTTALPFISDTVIIDGYTQPGASANTNAIDDADPNKRGFNGKLLIELKGSTAGGSMGGLTITASNTTVRGLIMNGFSTAIVVDGGQDVIEGNFLGTDSTGTLAPGSGTGVSVHSSNNRIGGTSPAARNVISGNSSNGVIIESVNNANANLIQGNFIGTDASGRNRLGNGGAAQGGLAGPGILLRQSLNNVIGGTQPGARNIVSANGTLKAGCGISVIDNSEFTTIQGNFIGLDVTGTVALGNFRAGLEIITGSDVLVGGATAEARNVISGNPIGIAFSGVDFTTVQGNYIGTDISGKRPLPNTSHGIDLQNSTNHNNRFGGTSAGAANTIAFNGGSGVHIQSGSFTRQNEILSNAIFSNAGLGIDLDPMGPTSNDVGDADTGPNNLQNYPEISSAALSNGVLTASYVVSSTTTSSAYPLRIEFFKADSNGEEGLTFLGFDTYAAGDAGTLKTLAFVPAVPVGVGNKLLATATDANGNTSEFSVAATMNGPNLPPKLANINGNNTVTVDESTLALAVAPNNDYPLPVTDADAAQMFAFSLILDPSPPLGCTAFDSTNSAHTSILQVSAITPTVTPGAPLAAPSSAAGTLRIKAGPNAAGTWCFVARVMDGIATNEREVMLTVNRTNSPPQITSNGGGDTAAISVKENSSVALATVLAIDLDTEQSLTYSLAGGADSDKFSIDATTGVLRFVSTPNFEQPQDAGANNVYDVVVRASDGGLSDLQTLAITVTSINEAPVITSNGGGASANISIPENSTAVTDVDAVDPDAGANLTYSKSGGADAVRFAINSTTGVLTFLTAPNFEAPTDVGGNNVYDVIVRVSDGNLTATQTIAVAVGNVNEAPVITSNGGGATASLSVTENTQAVTTVRATDIDAGGPNLNYSISSGADAAKFAIDSFSGVLAFITAPDFENPTDAGGNNVYDVVVQASDGSLTDTQAIAVTVTHVAEGCSTVVVNSNDSGAGSLREAINCANAKPGTDTISFNILGTGVHTISPTSALPTITDPVVIDGYTQPGAIKNTLAIGDNAVLLIELDGSGTPSGTDGLTITPLALRQCVD